MFAVIRRALTLWKMKRILREYLIAAADPRPLEYESIPLSDREICFVLIQFNTSEEAELQSALSSVIDIAATNDAMIDTFVSQLMVVTFGMLEGWPLGAHKQFVDSVLSKHGKNVKIVYSSGMAKIGNIGSKRRMSFSFIHPTFPKALVELSSMPYGEAREII